MATMKRMNFPRRKAQRRAEAEERNARTAPERRKAYRKANASCGKDD